MENLEETLEKINQRLEALEKGQLDKKGESKSYNTNKVHTIIDPQDMPDGCVSFVGKYHSPDGSMISTFGFDTFRVSHIFEQDTFEMCNVLTAFASEERINILKSLLQSGKTAKDLMQELNFNSTGKLYHHLSYLERIGCLRKTEDVYRIVGKYVSSVLLILISANIIINDGKNPSPKEV